MNVLDKLKKEYHIPTHSYIKAIQTINAREPEGRPTEVYVKRIKDIFGLDVQLDDKHARYVFLYLVQETIRTSFITDVFDFNALLSLAVEHATQFTAENEYVFAVKEVEPKLDNQGKPKRKKGAKKDEAERLWKENKGISKKDFMDLLMKELDMTRAGSQTYFYNCKKKFGV